MHLYPTISIKLKNGYTLRSYVEEDGDISRLHIATFDKDDVFNQDIAVIRLDKNKNDYDGEEFDLKICTDPKSEAYTHEFKVPCYHDPDIEEEENDDQESDEDWSEIIDIIEAEVPSIQYGFSGDHVKELQLRLRDLGYFSGVIGGNYLSKTMAAVEAFQLANGLHVNGAYVDDITYERLFSDKAIKSEMMEANNTTTTVLTQTYAKEMDWWKSDIQKIFAKGTDALITDVETGLQWHERRRGGTNHADVQPLTAKDTANLKKAYGGKWSWNRRAIWVTINGVTYAASMNGMPHGGSSIKNNGFDGHHCIHFTNSRTHCSNKVCPNHQKAIKKAASTKLSINVCNKEI